LPPATLPISRQRHARSSVLCQATMPDPTDDLWFMVSPQWVDTVEKGFSGVAPIVRARKGFLELLPERKGDSASAPNRNSILSAYHLISHKSDFFDSIGQMRSRSRRLHHVSCTPDSCRSCCNSENFHVVPKTALSCRTNRGDSRRWLHDHSPPVRAKIISSSPAASRPRGWS
jgi:hypothetical protein